MRHFGRRTISVLAASALMLSVTATTVQAGTPTSRPASTVDVRLIGMNDFHGNLEPPTGSSGRVSLDGSADMDKQVNAGGAAYIATHVKELEAAAKNSLLLSAGDNIGASPLASALFHDEPTIDFLNAIGLDASAVGNHEFDEGYKELLRMQFGGCHPTDGCVFRPTFTGAKFPYLGSNVYFTSGVPAVLPFTVKFVGGIPIGIIGATLHDLPTVVTPAAVEGLKFGDEVEAINRTANLLDRLRIKSLVVTMHQGDENQAVGGPNACNLAADGIAETIARTATSKVDVFFTGHSHQAYNCTVPDPDGNPRPVIQGLSFGRLLSVIDVKIDRKTRDVVRSATVANNEIVTRTTADPTVQAIVDEAKAKSAPIANRPVGSIAADITRSAAPTGEQPLGDVIADAQLAATTSNGAQIAITNPGGIRQDLTYASSPAGEGNGIVTYGEAFAVQPFANIMQTITMTGAQLDRVLEQQWDNTTGVKILQISSTLHYTQTLGNAIGDRVSNISIAGVPVVPGSSYRVSVNNFLAAGGDGFTTFADGTDLAGGPIDLDAFTAYLTANPNLAPPPADRVTAG